jgi:hypothetical protein
VALMFALERWALLMQHSAPLAESGLCKSRLSLLRPHGCLRSMHPCLGSAKEQRRALCLTRMHAVATVLQPVCRSNSLLWGSTTCTALLLDKAEPPACWQASRIDAAPVPPQPTTHVQTDGKTLFPSRVSAGTWCLRRRGCCRATMLYQAWWGAR